MLTGARGERAMGSFDACRRCARVPDAAASADLCADGTIACAKSTLATIVVGAWLNKTHPTANSAAEFSKFADNVSRSVADDFHWITLRLAPGKT